MSYTICCVCDNQTGHFAQFHFGCVCADCCRQAYMQAPEDTGARILFAALPGESHQRRAPVSRKRKPGRCGANTLRILLKAGEDPKLVSVAMGYDRGYVRRLARKANQVAA